MSEGNSTAGADRGPVALVAAAFFGSMLAACLLAAPAFADRAFSPRFGQNVAGGNIAIAANTLMTCPAADANCAGAQAGTASGAALNNNAYVMGHVDVDGDPATFSSSRAILGLPAGAEVLFAGLYFGARTSSGGGVGAAPAPNAAARGTVKLALPGGGYQTLAAAIDDSTVVAGSFQGFVDVTAQVAASGSGAYGVADVQAGTGIDRYSGWALVVAYRTAAGPPRNLSVFDGLTSVSSGAPAVTIPVSGFETPESGPVNTRLGLVAYEGDRNAAGDRIRLNGRPVFDAARAENNFFNSTIAVDGTSILSGDPAYVNQLGFDAVLTPANGFLANGATTATIEALTTLEQYLLGVVTFATELNPAVLEPPEEPPSEKVEITSEVAPGPAKLGEELERTVEVINPEGNVPVEEIEVVTKSDDPVEVVEASAGNQDCRTSSTRIRCELDEVEPGESERIAIVVRPLETGSLAVETKISVGGEVLDSAATKTKVKRGRAQVRLRQEASREQLRKRGRVRFDIVAAVRGDAAVVDGTICDRLPSALRLIRAPGAERDGGRACWQFDLLEPGERLRVEVLAQARSVSSVQRVLNPATLSAVNVRRESATTKIRVLPAAPGSDEAPPEVACRC